MDLWPENLYSVLDFKNPVVRRLLMASSTWFYKKSDKLIGLSQKAVEILKSRTGKPDNALCCIPQCCEKIYEENIFDEELVKRFGGKFNLVYAGNISPAQNFSLMADAAQKLRELGYDINWIIVGDGMSRQDAEKEVNEKGLGDCFYFEGFKPVEDIPKYTYIASGLVACLVQSSLLDCTIPAKVMSYIASGKPVILAMNGEAQSIVNDNKCGFAADSGDVNALVDNIIRLYSMTAEEREAMGRNGKELHYKRFERNVNLKKLIDFIFDETYHQE
ncbi:MAG: glycosyltransferase family 4 protein [Oscillospiraceae bacterium]|nr:glycosyltransferase family 4 protein [Oscillospiraceae bacterium]